ncbi:MAG: ribosomal protein S18-alanine N-acetyltransferase [Chloroflexota bacterium]
MNHIQFEPLTIAHLDEVMRLESLCFSAPWPRKTYERELLRNPHSHYWLLTLTKTEEITPFPIMVYGGYLSMGDEAHIMTIATHPYWRQRGLARQFLLRLLACIRKHGTPSVTLEVRASNTAAIALYGGLGFEQVGRRKNYYRHPREDAILLTLFGLDDGAVWRPLAAQMKNSVSD